MRRPYPAVRILRSPLLAETGDERTLPFPLTDGQSPEKKLSEKGFE